MRTDQNSPNETIAPADLDDVIGGAGCCALGVACCKPGAACCPPSGGAANSGSMLSRFAAMFAGLRR